MKADLVGLKEPMKGMFMKNHYDYLVVGAGITAAVFAHEAALAGKSCLVIDRRPHIAGNIYTKDVDGINVHEYGAHIFHTSIKPVWDYVNRFAEFNNYVNSPVAVYKDELYNMPFNMNTFSKMWGIRTPAEAAAIIEEARRAFPGKRVKAIVGGLHLYDRSEDEVVAFAHDLDESGIELVLTGHCTGEAVSTLARVLGPRVSAFRSGDVHVI